MQLSITKVLYFMGSCIEDGKGRKEHPVIMLHHLGAVHPNELGTKSSSRRPYKVLYKH